ncbi:MAG: oxidoreductase [Polyangiaceae bacterium UTPRO1]|jgi:3-hydroxyisobutyrate dehydrogenase|nr:NAD(P)-dependent oxidoreductase [Myxococcales bacterium]OQY65708.1 MAG: oxidoreductase [Polyangiaceae bacterium UTPRO1]
MESTDKPRVGWIGTGIMGAAMCGHLMAAGHAATVFTRTRSRAEPLLQRGAAWAETPAAVAAAADVVFTMVGYPADVRAVVLGATGVLAGARAGTILVDMSTSEPSLAREIDAAARARGVAALDAPVSGGDVGAREARLSIMVGGDADTFARVRPLLALMGKTIVLQGPAGSGQHTKMVNQILVASSMIGVCEGLLYARRAGLDVPTVLASVAGGAAGSWSLANYVPRIERGDLEPGFMIEHFVKDMKIALAESRRMGLTLPGLDLAERLYARLVDAGHGRKGIQALLLALEQLGDGADLGPRLT